MTLHPGASPDIELFGRVPGRSVRFGLNERPCGKVEWDPSDLGLVQELIGRLSGQGEIPENRLPIPAWTRIRRLECE